MKNQMKLKSNNQFKVKKSLLFLAMFMPTGFCYADITPAQDSAFYYQIGGGQDVVLPASQNTVYVPLDLNTASGIGWNCGTFSPTQTIQDSLNNIENSVQNVPGKIVSSATAAIYEFPMYGLARALPLLYNILQNNVLGANDQFELSLQSCQSMQRDISMGQDPYQDWATISMGNDWTKQMGISAVSGNMLGDGSGDINTAYNSVATDNGNNGIAWLGGANAGGLHQAPINVINDTVTAGFNLIFNRADNDESSIPGNGTPDNPNANHIADYWTSPTQAAQWVVGVVGDQEITTFPGGQKQSTPGNDLAEQYQQVYPTVFKLLSGMVSGNTPINEENLQAVSSPGVAINAQLIQDIQSLNPNTQAIVVNKLAENIAVGVTVDKALLAIQLLTVGAQDPVIKSVGPAQTAITQAISAFTDQLNQLQTANQLRTQLIANPMEDIINYVNQQTQQAVSVPKTEVTPASPMVNGGVMENQQ